MFTEDVSLFFNDFAVTATSGGYTANVLFDSPENLVMNETTITADYQITYKTGDLPNLVWNSDVTVNGVAYKVNYVRMTEDGKITVATLQK
jgi:hypothetical protein